jgi:hypothetical protein
MLKIHKKIRADTDYLYFFDTVHHDTVEVTYYKTDRSITLTVEASDISNFEFENIKDFKVFVDELNVFCERYKDDL